MSSSLDTIVSYFQKIEGTPGRLEMRNHFAELFKTLSAEDGAVTAYLALGRLTPDFIPVEFQISGKTIEKIVYEITGRDAAEMRQEFSKLGDFGDLLAKYHQVPAKPIRDVQILYRRLWEIATIQGKGSQQLKQTKIIELLRELDPQAAKYVIRILNGKLRLGASDKTMLDALASLEEDSKQFSEQLRMASGYVSDVGHIVYLYIKYGRDLLSRAKFVPGIPVASKLVERDATIEDILTRIPRAYIEPKYDGLRIQVHIYKREEIENQFKERIWSAFMEQAVETATLFSEPESEYEVKLFSRNLEEMTAMFPEIVEAARNLPLQCEKYHKHAVHSIVLDGEVIGYNASAEEFLTYQLTMSRRRKHDVDTAKTSVPVRSFVFDILYLAGEEIMSWPLDKRKEALAFLDENQEQNVFVKTPFHIVTEAKEADAIFLEYVGAGLEGVIFKDGSSTYEPGVRNFDWIKFKRAMRKELADTVDLVLLGYYFGEGRLAKHGIGALLAGIYDAANDQFLTVTKIGTGITDEQWGEIKTRCDSAAVPARLPRVEVPNALVPDVWLNPEIVVEVEADEITKSPLHSAGYALRFPRFMKFREKKPEDATTLQELIELSHL